MAVKWVVVAAVLLVGAEAKSIQKRSDDWATVVESDLKDDPDWVPGSGWGSGAGDDEDFPKVPSGPDYEDDEDYYDDYFYKDEDLSIMEMDEESDEDSDEYFYEDPDEEDGDYLSSIPLSTLENLLAEEMTKHAGKTAADNLVTIRNLGLPRATLQEAYLELVKLTAMIDEEKQGEEGYGDRQQMSYKGELVQQQSDTQQHSDIPQRGDTPQSDQYLSDGRYTVDVDQLGVGVEPLVPQEPGQVDLGYGVEPVEKPSFLGWLNRGWEETKDTFETLGDHAETAWDSLGDKAEDVVDKIQDVAATAIVKVQDAAQEAGEHVVSAYHTVREKLGRWKERVATIFSKFGTTIQLGGQYCFAKLLTYVDQARGSEVLDKLEQQLQAGNERVSRFFTVLGQKITQWKEQHSGQNVDAGLIIVHGQNQGVQQGQDQYDQFQGWEQFATQNTEQGMPDFFQDPEVASELNQMVYQGILSPGDLEVFSQQTQTSRRRRTFG